MKQLFAAMLSLGCIHFATAADTPPMVPLPPRQPQSGAVVSVLVPRNQQTTPASELIPLPAGFANVRTEVYEASKARNYWTWTPTAEHHKAIVHVRQGNAGGTGVLVWYNDEADAIIVTANHVVEQASSARVAFYDGKWLEARIIARDAPEDTALLRTTLHRKDLPVIPVSDETPPPGAVLEICGFGGPINKLRHFRGVTREDTTTSTLTANAYLLSGDSGGPVIYNGSLVGVNRGGRNIANVGIVDQHRETWLVHYPAVCSGPGVIRQLFQRICPPSKPCPPNYYQRFRNNPRPPSQPQRPPGQPGLPVPETVPPDGPTPANPVAPDVDSPVTPPSSQPAVTTEQFNELTAAVTQIKEQVAALEQKQCACQDLAPLIARISALEQEQHDCPDLATLIARISALEQKQCECEIDVVINRITTIEQQLQVGGAEVEARVIALEARQAELTQLVTNHGNALQTIQQSSSAVNSQIAELLRVVEANNKTIADVSQALSQQQTAIIANVEFQLNEFRQQMAADTPVTPPTGNNDQAAQDAVAQFANRVWIYYTSRDAPELRQVDDQINILRGRGYPIVITYLTPQQASVTGVPKIFIPAQNKEITGIRSCLTFLASLVPR